jgi:hypothetical protein
MRGTSAYIRPSTTHTVTRGRPITRRIPANVVNKIQSDANSMRLGRKIQIHSQVFANLSKDPRDSPTLPAPPRKERGPGPIVQQPVELAADRFPLPRALRLMRVYKALQSPLLRTHQGMVESTVRHTLAEFARIGDVVKFQRCSNFDEKIAAAYRANAGHEREQSRQDHINLCGARKKTRSIE